MRFSLVRVVAVAQLIALLAGCDLPGDDDTYTPSRAAQAESMCAPFGGVRKAYFRGLAYRDHTDVKITAICDNGNQTERSFKEPTGA
jgi:hypothetical protein